MPVSGPSLSLLLANATTAWHSFRHANQREGERLARPPCSFFVAAHPQLTPPGNPSAPWLPRFPFPFGLSWLGWKCGGENVTVPSHLLTFRVQPQRRAKSLGGNSPTIGSWAATALMTFSCLQPAKMVSTYKEKAKTSFCWATSGEP